MNGRFRQDAYGVSREDAVGRAGVDLGRAPFDQGFRRLGERSAGRYHIIDHDRNLTVYVAHDLRYFGDVRLRAALEDDRERGAQALREVLRAWNAARIGRDHDDFVAFEPLCF